MARIIFAGANEQSRFGLVRALDHHGHELTLAPTASELIDARRVARAELVIVHCRGSDDLTRIVGFRVEDADTPVLVLLDKQAEGLLFSALNAGADAVLVGPHRLLGVLDAIDRLRVRTAITRIAA